MKFCGVQRALAVVFVLGCLSPAQGAHYEHALQLLDPSQFRDMVGNGDSLSTVSVDKTTAASGDFVTVTVETQGVPSSYQWVGMWSPSTVGVNTVVPAKYAYCAHDPRWLSQGKATLRFRMVDMRADFVFRFMNCSRTHYPRCDATAQAGPVTLSDSGRPARPRVVPGAAPGRFRVTWGSGRGAASKPYLLWTTDPAGSTFDVLAAGTTTTFSAADLCGAPAATYGWQDVGFTHTADLPPVDPGRVVRYKLGDDAGYGKEFRFRVPPANRHDSPTTVFAFGDLGRSTGDDSYTWRHYGRPAINTTRALVAEVQRGVGDAVFHFGDISYATGYMAVWDDFLDMLSPLSSSLIYTISTGNHEADAPAASFPAGRTPSFYNGTDSGGECNVPATQFFPMPRRGIDEAWWSFDVGNIHLVAMGTEYDFRAGSPQLRWLEADLAAVDPARTPWIVFSGHRPMYISSTFDGPMSADQTVARLLRQHVEPLLKRYGVQLALYGHNHAVQRFCAAFDNACVTRATRAAHGEDEYRHPGATVHVVAGTGGASFTRNAESPPPATIDGPVFYRYGYARLTTPNSSHLHYEWVDNVDGQVYDSFWIVQKPYEQPSGPPAPAPTPPPGWIVPVVVVGALAVLALLAVACRRASLRRTAFVDGEAHPAASRSHPNVVQPPSPYTTI